MDPAQSLYDSPSSMMDYSRQDEPWQPNDGMELELVGKTEGGKPKAVGHVKVKNKPTTIASRYHTLSRSGDKTNMASASFQPQAWKYQFALVMLSLSVSVVAAILASVALKNAGQSPPVRENVLPASSKQNLLHGVNSSGKFWFMSVSW